MLGYRGRSNRRDFIAGAALTVVGPTAVAMLIKGSIPALFATFPREAAVGLAVVLTLMVCAAIIAWFWGWSVLVTRRARDAGLPAWSGAASVVVLFAIWPALASGLQLPPWVGTLAFLALIALWALPPSRCEDLSGLLRA